MMAVPLEILWRHFMFNEGQKQSLVEYIHSRLSLHGLTPPSIYFPLPQAFEEDYPLFPLRYEFNDDNNTLCLNSTCSITVPVSSESRNEVFGKIDFFIDGLIRGMPTRLRDLTAEGSAHGPFIPSSEIGPYGNIPTLPGTDRGRRIWPPSVGEGDVSPAGIGRGPSGSLIGPEHPIFVPPHQSPIAPNSELPQGAVPPGARFDPITPEGLGRPRRPGGRQPSGDPYPDMFMPPGPPSPFI